MKVLKKQVFILCLCFIFMTLAGSWVMGQDKEARLKNLKGNLYHVENVGGGNIVCSVGDDGVLLVDAGTNPGDAEKILAAIGIVTNQPVRYVINTHWHSDHTAANEVLKKKGAIIVAHHNVAARMKTELYMDFFDRKVPPAPAGALPNVTFAKQTTLYFNDDEVMIVHIQPGHTDGDGIVFFKNANVIHVGDLYFNGYYPYIGVSSGGSVNGMITVLNKVLQKIDNETLVVPGHGPLSNKAELEVYVRMLSSIRDKVAPMVKAGKSLEAVQKAKPTQDFDAEWGQVWMKGDEFVRLLYMDFTRK
jgi:cyclase